MPSTERSTLHQEAPLMNPEFQQHQMILLESVVVDADFLNNLVAINPNRQLAQARNAQRRADINTIYKALEQYLIDKGSYPNSINTNFKEICNTGSQKSTDTLNPTTLCDNKADLRVLVPTYLASIPTAPSGGVYRVGLNSNNKINGIQIDTNGDLDTIVTKYKEKE